MQVDERTFRKMIKAKARVTLFRRPGFALLAGLYTFLPMMLFALVLQLIAQAEWGVGLRLAALGAAALAYLLVLSPLTMGKIRYLCLCCRGQGVAPLGELFAYSSGWKGYVRALQMTALTEGMTVLWSLLFFLPGGCYLYSIITLPVVTEEPLYLSLFLLVCGWIMVCIQRQTYLASMILVAGNHNIRPMTALRTARTLYRGQYPLKCRFYTSFLGWVVLSLATGGIATIVYDLYYTTSLILLTDSLCANALIRAKAQQTGQGQENGRKGE